MRFIGSAFDEFGDGFDDFGLRLERELEDEFGGDFDEFGHGFGKNSLGMSLGLILMSLVSLGVRLLCVCCFWRCV